MATFTPITKSSNSFNPQEKSGGITETWASILTTWENEFRTWQAATVITYTNQIRAGSGIAPTYGLAVYGTSLYGAASNTGTQWTNIIQS